MRHIAKTYGGGTSRQCFFGTQGNVGAETLFAEEKPAVAKAIERRVAEFSTGRWCAREAMRRLGWAPCPIPVGPSRAPVWPMGITGSISHTPGFTCALVSAGTGCVGIDVERSDRSLPEAAWRLILSSPERMRLGTGLERLLAFSAKESFFKAAFARVGGYFDFDAVEFRVTGAGTFGLRVRKSPGSCFAERNEYPGWFRIRFPFLLTAMEIQ
jgi:4'-phosphopantetheinyl transferase EntD